MEKTVKHKPRRFTRIEFTTRAEVEINNVVAECELVDISISALYVRGDIKAVVGDACELRLFLGDEDPMVIHGIGKVVRRDALGLAIAFEGFYCDSVGNLQHLNLQNAEGRPAPVLPDSPKAGD